MEKKILSLADFELAYRQKNPHKYPVQEQVDLGWQLNIAGMKLNLTMVLLVAIVIAINILSAGHTIGVLQRTYDPNMSEWVLQVISVAGFIGVELMLVFFMSMKERGWYEWAAILLAFAASLAANVFSAAEALQAEETWIQGVAFLFGIFAPSANLAVGQVFHKYSNEYSRESRRVREEYLSSVGEYRSNVVQSYRTYLSRVGVREEADKMQYISGEDVSTVEVVPSTTEEGVSTPQELAAVLRSTGREDWSYQKLREEYRVGNGTISEAKKILRGE